MKRIDGMYSHTHTTDTLHWISSRRFPFAAGLPNNVRIICFWELPQHRRGACLWEKAEKHLVDG
ncbi:hypothetical protein J6590_026536 [Homalodisca vitripennis]|nr:hypothetical protein J6590_026536 [Homalodisca vitripennis]